MFAGVSVTVQPPDRAGMRQSIVHFGQNPRANALLTLKFVQAAGPIGRLGIQGDGGLRWLRAVIIIERVRSRWIGERIMVVQNNARAVVGERADQVTEVLMPDQVADDDVLHPRSAGWRAQRHTACPDAPGCRRESGWAAAGR